MNKLKLLRSALLAILLVFLFTHKYISEFAEYAFLALLAALSIGVFIFEYRQTDVPSRKRFVKQRLGLAAFALITLVIAYLIFQHYY